jgi:hypothetical protein
LRFSQRLRGRNKGEGRDGNMKQREEEDWKRRNGGKDKKGER